MKPGFPHSAQAAGFLVLILNLILFAAAACDGAEEAVAEAAAGKLGNSSDTGWIDIGGFERVEVMRDGLVWDPDSHVSPERGFALPLPRTAPKGKVLFALDHRARQSLAAEPLRDLLGFDAGGLKILLGLRYGLLENLDFGIERLNGNPEIYDVYGADARWAVLKESRHILDLALAAGFTWFDQTEAKDDIGWSGRLQAGKSLFQSIYLSAGIMAHTNSSHGYKGSADPEPSLAIPAYLGWVVLPYLTLAAEGVMPVAGYSAGWPSWTVGPKFTTHGHSFAVLITTTQYTTADGLASGSDRPDRPVFGFSITREFATGE